jgi:ligand-binding sensor domain-containing protein/signal transduction histidine kinase
VRISLLTLLFLSFLLPQACFSQQQNYSSFTMKDGLPSNMVYRCLEDDEGFLWIATDAGIARFDGKHFQVFTTAHGLPDNEVLAVVKEKDGTIWVNCFKQGPAYFDNIQNRFVKPAAASELSKLPGTYISYMYTLENGGVMYINVNSSQIYKNRKLQNNSDRADLPFLVKENGDGSVISLGYKRIPNSRKARFKLVHRKTGNSIDSVVIGTDITGYLQSSVNDGSLYLFYGANNKCYVYSNFQTNPLRFRSDSFTLPSPIANHSFTPTSVYFLCESGKMYVFNKKTMKPEGIFEGDYLSNSFFNDSKGNIWISTIDKGVIVHRENQLFPISLPQSFTHTNFISLARKTDGTILAGNYYGEVIEVLRNKFTVHKLVNKIPSRQRKILLARNNVYSFSEEGIMVNFKRQLTNKLNSSPYTGKTAIIYNDSILLAGTPSGLLKIELSGEKISSLPTLGRRITCITRMNNGLVYFGSTDGLYKYDMKKDLTTKILTDIPVLRERISTLCTTSDDILWVGTASRGVIGIRNDKPLVYITDSNGIINNSCKSIVAGRNGELWLGTEQGISALRYTLNNEKVHFTVQNFSMSDGLTSNGINELLFDNDTVYAATSNGISIVPANIHVAPFDIPVRIINMTIDQRDTAIYRIYKLPYGRKNIQIRFAAIELNGHFKNLEYSLDGNKSWIPLHDNFLNLELNYGEHSLAVRAVDQNGNVSRSVLSTEFHIATPYYKTVWFWIIAIIVLQAATIYIAVKWLKTRKRSRLARQIAGVQNASLEQQAFTSLMNPHFMFNALNSVQHYINLQDRQNANRYLTDFASLIRKNFEAAQQSFIPLEQELDNLKIYLRLEQMRFSGRFVYNLNIDDNVDPEQWMIPTMMLQPLLENALLHGLMPSAIKGELELTVREIEKFLQLTITDNGIGMKNSLYLREREGHKSRGMELIQKRIAALSHFASQPISINMSPAFESNSNPGNKVIILIPSELYTTWHKAHQQGMISV